MGQVFVTIGDSVYYPGSSINNLIVSYDSLSMILNQDNGVYNLTVTINNQTVVCESNCTLEYSSIYTPYLSSVSPTSVSDSTEIIINGGNFGSSSSKLNVQIGTQMCQVTNSNDNQINCTLNGLDLGPQKITVYVNCKKKHFFLFLYWDLK